MEEEKHQAKEVIDNHGFAPEGADEEVGIVNKSGPLKQDLQGRHMQMIAIGTLCSCSPPLPCLFAGRCLFRARSPPSLSSPSSTSDADSVPAID